MQAVTRQAAMLLIVLGSARSICAQPAPSEAITIGHGAIELFESGKYASALAHFQRADAIAHSPVFALYIARCQRKLGELLAARVSYETILDETLDDDAPEPWMNAQKTARAELDELATLIPSVVVEAGAAPSSVELDGATLPLGSLGDEIELDPGPHRVILRESTGTREISVRLAEGEQAVRVIFAEQPRQTAEPRATTALAPSPARRSTEPESDGKGMKSSALVPLVMGSAALVVGITAGIVALAKTQELKGDCDGNRCNPEDEVRTDPIHKWASVSTIAFAVAGAGLTVGAVLYLADPVTGASHRHVAFHVTGGFP